MPLFKTVPKPKKERNILIPKFRIYISAFLVPKTYLQFPTLSKRSQIQSFWKRIVVRRLADPLSAASMSNTLKLGKSHIEQGLAANPQLKKYEEKLRQIDKNQDGEIDIIELCVAIEEMSTIEKQGRLLRRVGYLMAAISLLTIAAIVGLAYAVVYVSKDSNVSSSGIMVTKDSAANPIATGQVVTLDDARQMINKSLIELGALSFLVIPSGPGGAGTVVHVAEVQLTPNTSVRVTTTAGTVYEFDVSGIHQVNTANGRRRKLLYDYSAGASYSEMKENAGSGMKNPEMAGGDTMYPGTENMTAPMAPDKKPLPESGAGKN